MLYFNFGQVCDMIQGDDKQVIIPVRRAGIPIDLTTYDDIIVSLNYRNTLLAKYRLNIPLNNNEYDGTLSISVNSSSDIIIDITSELSAGFPEDIICDVDTTLITTTILDTQVRETIKISNFLMVQKGINKNLI